MKKDNTPPVDDRDKVILLTLVPFVLLLVPTIILLLTYPASKCMEDYNGSKTGCSNQMDLTKGINVCILGVDPCEVDKERGWTLDPTCNITIGDYDE